ncbi:MAG: DUF1453 family protein [Thermoprotei archaeon]
MSAPPAEFSSPGEVISALIIIFIFFRRIRSYQRGSTFSQKRIIRIPLLYTLILVFEYLPSAIGFESAQIPLFTAGVVLGLAAGVLTGLKICGDTQFFSTQGGLMFRRSLRILFLWIALLVIRYGLVAFYGAYSLPGVVAALATAYATGLFYGEAIGLFNMRKDFELKASAKTPGSALL